MLSITFVFMRIIYIVGLAAILLIAIVGYSVITSPPSIDGDYSFGNHYMHLGLLGDGTYDGKKITWEESGNMYYIKGVNELTGYYKLENGYLVGQSMTFTKI